MVYEIDSKKIMANSRFSNRLSTFMGKELWKESFCCHLHVIKLFSLKESKALAWGFDFNFIKFLIFAHVRLFVFCILFYRQCCFVSYYMRLLWYLVGQFLEPFFGYYIMSAYIFTYTFGLLSQPYISYVLPQDLC